MIKELLISFGYLRYEFGLLISILAGALFVGVLAGIVSVIVAIVFVLLSFILFPIQDTVKSVGGLAFLLVHLLVPLSVGLLGTLVVYPFENDDGERTDIMAPSYWNLQFPVLLLIPTGLLAVLKWEIVPLPSGTAKILLFISEPQSAGLAGEIAVAILALSLIYRPAIWLIAVYLSQFKFRDGPVALLLRFYPGVVTTVGFGGVAAVVHYRLLEFVSADIAMDIRLFIEGLPVLSSVAANALDAAVLLGISTVSIGLVGLGYDWHDFIIQVSKDVLGFAKEIGVVGLSIIVFAGASLMRVLRYVMLLPDKE